MTWSGSVWAGRAWPVRQPPRRRPASVGQPGPLRLLGPASLPQLGPRPVAWPGSLFFGSALDLFGLAACLVGEPAHHLGTAEGCSPSACACRWRRRRRSGRDPLRGLVALGQVLAVSEPALELQRDLLASTGSCSGTGGVHIIQASFRMRSRASGPRPPRGSRRPDNGLAHLGDHAQVQPDITRDLEPKPNDALPVLDEGLGLLVELGLLTELGELMYLSPRLRSSPTSPTRLRTASTGRSSWGSPWPTEPLRWRRRSP